MGSMMMMMMMMMMMVVVMLSGGVSAGGDMDKVDFEACTDVENLLGIEEVSLSRLALAHGIVVAKIVHTPEVDFDAPAFVRVQIGQYTFFKDFCNDMLLNPEGCALSKGEERTIYPVVLNKDLMEAWFSLEPGTKVPVKIDGFAFSADGAGSPLTRLGCIKFALTKQAYTEPTLNLRRLDSEKRVLSAFGL